MKTRQSNLELLRIVCMCVVPVFHAMLYNGVYFQGNGNTLISLLLPWAVTADYAFISLSFYFLQKNTRVKFDRFLSIAALVLTAYLVRIITVRGIFGYNNSNPFIDTFLVEGAWWFIYPYLIMLLIHPLLNRVIARLSTKALIVCVLALLMPFLFLGIQNAPGFYKDCYAFLMVYFLIALLSRNDFASLKHPVIALILIYIFMHGSTICIWKMVPEEVYEPWCKYMIGRYNFPSMIAGVFTFTAFKNIRIANSKMINWIAGCVFYVFLLHETVMAVFWKYGVCDGDVGLKPFWQFSIEIIAYVLAAFAFAIVARLVYENSIGRLVTFLIDSFKNWELPANKNRNSAIDLCKYIMAVLVIAIHVLPFEGNLGFYVDNCVARIADPLFFAISSYLFFAKAERVRAGAPSGKYDIKQFAYYWLRLLKIYAIWFVINIPLFDDTFAGYHGLAFAGKLFQVFFLSGPFGTALWFLSALLLGMLLTYLVVSFSNVQIALAISLPFHLFTILEISYGWLVSDNAVMNVALNWFNGVFGWLANGLNYGFFYCALGAYVAIRRSRGRGKVAERKYIYALLVSMVVLVIECTLIRDHNTNSGYGSLFALIPVAYFGLLSLSNWEGTYSPSCHKLQMLTLPMFTSQFLVIKGLQRIFGDAAWYTGNTTVQFAYVLAATTALSAVYVLIIHKKFPTLVRIVE